MDISAVSSCPRTLPGPEPRADPAEGEYEGGKRMRLRIAVVLLSLMSVTLGIAQAVRFADAHNVRIPLFDPFFVFLLPAIGLIALAALSLILGRAHLRIASIVLVCLMGVVSLVTQVILLPLAISHRAGGPQSCPKSRRGAGQVKAHSTASRLAGEGGGLPNTSPDCVKTRACGAPAPRMALREERSGGDPRVLPRLLGSKWERDWRIRGFHTASRWS
jgi:hypothetical protein